MALWGGSYEQDSEMARSRGLLIDCHHLFVRTGSASGRSISSEDEVQPTISHTPHTSCTVFAPPRFPLAVARSSLAIRCVYCHSSTQKRRRSESGQAKTWEGEPPIGDGRVLASAGKMTSKAVVRGATS